MDKSEFLRLLSEKLSEELPYSVVQNNVAYYQNYIDGELAKNRTIEAIMEELGDPYMIARSIIDVQTGEAFSQENIDDDISGDVTGTNGKIIVNSSGWLTTAKVILAIVVVLVLLGSIISFLLPIVGPLIVVGIIIWLVKKYN